MTVERFGPINRASRLWPAEPMAPREIDADGPVAFIKMAVATGWRYKSRLAICALMGAVLAFAYAHSLPKTYNAAATMLLEPRYFTSTTGTVQQGLDLNSAESELQIILSERLLSRVFHSLDLAASPELEPEPPGVVKGAISQLIGQMSGQAETSRQVGPAIGLAPSAEDIRIRAAFANFVSRVSARRVGQSYVVEISYASSDPALPARVANAIVSSYILQSVVAKEETARAGTETLQGRLDVLQGQMSAAEEAMRNGQLPKSPTPDADAKITGAALFPLSPSSPKTTLIIVFGGILGLFIGTVGLAIGLVFDRKLRSPKDLTAHTNLTCLAGIPEKGGRIAAFGSRFQRRSLQVYTSSVRDLRTSIDLAAANRKGGRNTVVAMVGCSKSVGVASLSLNLAQMVGRAGRHVTLISTEFPRADSNMLPQSLTDIVLGATQALPMPEYREGIAIMALHSQDSRSNAVIDFCHPRVRETIEAARLKGDVILDLPALDVSMDAVALATHADATVLVTRYGTTHIDDVAAAEYQLSKNGATVIGYVINRQRS